MKTFSMKEVRRVSIRKISDLFIVVLLSSMASILLANYSFADVKVEKIQTSKVASFNCGGKNANGFTVTPDYYIAACDHSGPINVYKKNNTRSVVVSKNIPGYGYHHNDLDYYAPKKYLVVDGTDFYDPSTLRRAATAKYSLSSGATYDVDDDVFVVSGMNKVEVRGDILKEKSPKLYKSFSTIHGNQGSFYHNGVFYRVIYCLRSGSNTSTCNGAGINKGQSAVIAYDVTTGKKVGHYITSDFNQAGELQDGSVYGGVGYLSSGGGGIYKITGPASLLKLLRQDNPMKFNKNKTSSKEKEESAQPETTKPETTKPETTKPNNQSGDSDGAQGNNGSPTDWRENADSDPCDLILPGGSVPPGLCGDHDDDEEKMYQTIRNVLDTVYLWVGILAVLFIIVGGINYTVSQGDPGKVAKAKNTILYAIVGLIITLLAFSITQFVLNALSGRI